MKRLIFAAVAALLLATALAANAQTATPIPFDAPTATAAPLDVSAGAQAASLEDGALERAELAADRAEFAASQSGFALEQAAAAVERADSMLNQFQTLEAVVGIIGFALPALAVVAAVIGLNRLSSAQNDVRTLREELTKDIQEVTAGAQREIEASRQEARHDIQAATAQLADALSQREQDMDALRETAQTVRQEAANARLASALLPLGEQQYKASDVEGAIATYERALRLDDRNPVTHYRLGYVYNRINQFDQALDRLVDALEIDKEFMPAKAAIGYTYRRMAEALPEKDDRRELLFSEAELRLREALTSAPTLVDDDGESWWGSLGGLYKRRGQTELARDAYQRAGKVTPHSSYPFSNLAVLEMQNRNREAMLRAFQHVERVARAETQARTGNYYGLADLLTAQLALGKTNEAHETMQALFDIAPAAENVLELELDTLRRMAVALGGDDAAPQVGQAIADMEAELARRAAGADAG